jgi:peptidoglycan/LPS O-acetylase OafA/YrhL
MNPVQAQFHLGYHRSLNGLRGVAILFVLLSHGGVTAPGFGFIAVNTFFVLSGFLITCLLIEEYDKFNGISLKYFYFRRMLRLLPALIVMLLVFLVFAFLMDPHGRAVRELQESLFALFYFTNWADAYHIGRHISLLHTWSLSVEEQFYIIWPGILLWLLSKTSRSSLLCWIFLAAFISVIIRISLFVGDNTYTSGNIFPPDPLRLLLGTDTRADSLLLGCFAGVLLSSNLAPRREWFMKILKISAMASGIGLLLMGTCNNESPWMIYFGWFLASVFAMTLIIHLVSGSQSLIRLFLENAVLVYVGEISYGLYVWHYPILIAMQQHHLPYKNLIYLLPVFPVVLLSYYLIEKPCLRLKNQFQRVSQM